MGNLSLPMDARQKEKTNVTRSAGYIDNFLSRLRCRQANHLIPPASRGGRLLDIGCGTYPFFLINTEFACKYGIDKVVIGQSHAHWQKKGINFFNYDLEQHDTLSFEDGFFDVVTMLAVFEHIEPVKLLNQLKEIRRVMKPCGSFIMTTPAGWTDFILTLMAALRLVSAVEFQEHKEAYTPQKIIELYKKADFLRSQVKTGYFEMFMNIWVVAVK
jgi:2-polyprenyl-3-methyl-5-hydroxy-6-metoxy-1,4-benzoquinol methylase